MKIPVSLFAILGLLSAQNAGASCIEKYKAAETTFKEHVINGAGTGVIGSVAGLGMTALVNAGGGKGDFTWKERGQIFATATIGGAAIGAGVGLFGKKPFKNMDQILTQARYPQDDPEYADRKKELNDFIRRVQAAAKKSKLNIPTSEQAVTILVDSDSTDLFCQDVRPMTRKEVASYIIGKVQPSAPNNASGNSDIGSGAGSD